MSALQLSIFEGNPHPGAHVTMRAVSPVRRIPTNPTRRPPARVETNEVCDDQSLDAEMDRQLRLKGISTNPLLWPFEEQLMIAALVAGIPPGRKNPSGISTTDKLEYCTVVVRALLDVKAYAELQQSVGKDRAFEQFQSHTEQTAPVFSAFQFFLFENPWAKLFCACAAVDLDGIAWNIERSFRRKGWEATSGIHQTGQNA
jgi:hypothetical protein